MKGLIKISLILVLLFGSVPFVNAIKAVTPLWEQLPNNEGDVGSRPDLQIVADDFILTEASSISQIEIWNRIAGPVNIYLDIYANTTDTGGNNIPGVSLYSGIVASSGIDEEDAICSTIFCQYRHTLTLDSPLELSSGHYWLSVYGVGSDFGWSYADSPADLPNCAIKFPGSEVWGGDWGFAVGFQVLESEETCPATVEVTNTADSGIGSLRQAILDICPGGTITFDLGLSGATIWLDSQLTIDKDLTIDGSALAEKVTVTTDNMDRVIQVYSGVTAAFESLRITHGNTSGFGGGINNAGNLTVNDSIIYNNLSSQSGAGIFNNGGTLLITNSSLDNNYAESKGGAIFNSTGGNATVNNSTFSENTGSSGGGIDNTYDSTIIIMNSTFIGNQATDGNSGSGGALNNAGSMTVVNSTLANNSAPQYGGGISNNAGTLTLFNSTLSGNVGNEDGDLGHGLANVSTNIQATLHFGNTIIANSPYGISCLNTGLISTNLNNLVEETSDGGCSASLVADPGLAPLADNGGPTQTMALQEGSPATNAGDDTICSGALVNNLDQRGVTRPQGNHCDIGAYEVQLDILPDILPPATVGFHYSQQLSAVGGTPAYSWSSIGLSGEPFRLIGDTGILESEDNILNPAVPGVITFTAIWHDSAEVEFRKEYSLTVLPALAFSPTALPTGKVGEVYSQVITLSGGIAPYTIDPTSIPTWLTYETDPDAGTITISGTPTGHGSYSVEIQAVDVLGVKGEQTYRIWIGPERAFTWSPELSNQFEMVTFTAISDLGSTSLRWWRGDNPGDACGTYVPTITNILYAEFNESGSYQICLDYWVDSVNGYVRDEQWITINNVPPVDVQINFNQEPALIDNPVFARIRFFDWDSGPFTCTIDWGDGTDPQTIPADSTDECKFAEHAYTVAGTYTVTGFTTEEGVGSSESTIRNLEVLDPATLPPVAWGDEWLVGESGPSRIRLEAYDLMGNEDLTFEIIDPPIHGATNNLVFEACIDSEYESGGRLCSAVVDYTPDINDPPYNGSDSFTFTASDAGLTSDPAMISLVIAPNEAPSAYGNSLTVVSTVPTKIILTATDPDVINNVPDNLEIEFLSGPVLGSLEGLHIDSYQQGPSGVNYSWVVTYTPNGSTGIDSFDFQVTDNNYHTSTATIDLTVQEPITWHVNTFDDVDNGTCNSDHCSLREAVIYAISGDSIDFEGLLGDLPGTIVLNGEQIWINKDLTIIGPGADQLAVSGGAELNDESPWEHSRIFSVSGFEFPVNVTISGLTIKDGRDIQGGGVQVSEGSNLIMNDCVIGPNNIVTYAGGGIFNERASLTLNRCTVTGNEGTGSLGGAGVTTAYSDATTMLINSTVSGNITNNYGGGIFVGSESLVSLIHTTVTGNISNANFAEPGEERGGGAGVYIDPYGDGQLEVHNSIIAGNTDLTDPEDAGHEKWPDVYGSVTSLGGNLVGDDMGSSGWNENDLVGTASDPIDPGLDSLLKLNAPGNTPTHALLPGSLAMDAASCLLDVRIDQRGITRPQGYFCDIGAFEFEQEPVFWDVFLPLIINGSPN